jgi:uncharacterized membrane protein
MTKQKFLSAALIFAGVWVLIFLMCSFIAWELNPSKWPSAGRALFAMASMIISSCATGAYLEVYKP